MAPITDPNCPPGETRPLDPLARGRKILIVDDELAICRLIETSLRSDGFEHLVFCHNAGSICSIVANERPKLIILDVMMPCGNGLRALRSLKANPATGSIPVILISGYDPEVVGECARQFADAFLPKPFTAPAILTKVSELLAA